jgi:hypothetical protein
LTIVQSGGGCSPGSPDGTILPVCTQGDVLVYLAADLSADPAECDLPSVTRPRLRACSDTHSGRSLS